MIRGYRRADAAPLTSAVVGSPDSTTKSQRVRRGDLRSARVAGSGDPAI